MGFPSGFCNGYCIRYQQEKFEGLIPRERNATAHKISPKLLEEAIRLFRQGAQAKHQHHTNFGGGEKAEPGRLTHTTLHEVLAGKWYSASVMRRYLSQKCVTQRWGPVHCNDLWQGYTKTSPQLKAGEDSVDTHLYYLVDDATRCILGWSCPSPGAGIGGTGAAHVAPALWGTSENIPGGGGHVSQAVGGTGLWTHGHSSTPYSATQFSVYGASRGPESWWNCFFWISPNSRRTPRRN